MAKKSPVQGKKRGSGLSSGKSAAKASTPKSMPKASKPPAMPKAKGTVSMGTTKSGKAKLNYKPIKSTAKKAPKAKAVRPSTPGMARKYDLYSNLAKNSTGAEKKEYQAKAKAVAAKAAAPKKPQKKTAAGVARTLRAAANKERIAGNKMINQAIKSKKGGSSANAGFGKAIMAERKIAKIENIQASTKARKGSGFAAFSKKASKVSAGKSTGSGKRTRSFSEGKIKRDARGRFARK